MRKALVIFGATGDLAKEKLYPALKHIKGVEIIGYGRKEIENNKLYDHNYVQGDFKDSKNLLNALSRVKAEKVYFYISLPPSLYVEVIKFIKANFLKYKPSIALEKPFGSSLSEAIKIAKMISSYETVDKSKNSTNFYLVDHYLAKPDIQKLINKEINFKDVNVLGLSMLEDNDVSKRGNFYDEVGVVKDFVQSHLLNTLNLLFKNNMIDNLLTKIKLVADSTVLGQYEGYLNTPGVDKKSLTPTYFKSDFLYEDLQITLRTGKALSEPQLLLTVKDKNGLEKILFNQGGKAKSYEGHFAVFNDFLSSSNKYSLSTEEALQSWKVVEKIYKDINGTKLVIYPAGSLAGKIETLNT